MKKILQINGAAVTLENVEQKTASLHFDYKGQHYHFRKIRLGDGTFVLEEELAEGVWQAASGGIWQSAKNIRTVQIGALEARISDTPSLVSSQAQTAALSPVAPMPGLVRQVLVKKGDKVTMGHALVVIEAMKLQLSLTAGGDGVVEKILVTEGQLVAEGAELVQLTAKK